jgi:glycosyltransferase involved in cell wall biosynthesis
MSNKPLVSIIIPTFNRAHLIGETLDSVIAQTYTNWECIVVDDGSTDHTDKVLEQYCDKDKRIQYCHRPKHLKPGGNAARNFGFELSKGAYVNWFDSDDLMENNFIEVKLKSILQNPKLDFVVARGVNYFEDGRTEDILIKNNKSKALNANNFILSEVFWITHDFFIKREKVGDVRFDTEIKSGQEYNFFIKVMAINHLKGLFIDKKVFKRRVHRESIQGSLKKIGDGYLKNQYILYKNTLVAVSHLLNGEAKNLMLERVTYFTFELNRRSLPTLEKHKIYKVFIKEKGIFKTSTFIIAIFMARLFGKGFNLMNYSRS